MIDDTRVPFGMETLVFLCCVLDCPNCCIDDFMSKSFSRSTSVLVSFTINTCLLLSSFFSCSMLTAILTAVDFPELRGLWTTIVGNYLDWLCMVFCGPGTTSSLGRYQPVVVLYDTVLKGRCCSWDGNCNVFPCVFTVADYYYCYYYYASPTLVCSIVIFMIIYILSVVRCAIHPWRCNLTL